MHSIQILVLGRRQMGAGSEHALRTAASNVASNERFLMVVVWLPTGQEAKGSSHYVDASFLGFYRNKVLTGIGCNLLNLARCTFVAAAIRSRCRSGRSRRGCTGLHGGAVSPVYRLAFTLWWGGSSVQVKFRLGGAQRSHCSGN